MTQKTKRIIYGIAAAAIAPLLAAGAISCGTTTPAAPAAGESSTADERAESAQNVRLVGYNDLQGRESLVVTTHSDQANGSWVYVGHHESYWDDKPKMNPITGKEEWNGTSILDVDDPANPRDEWHIPNRLEPTRAVSVVYDYKFDGSGRDYLIRNSEALTQGETGTDLRYRSSTSPTERRIPSKIHLVGEITGTPPNSCGAGAAASSSSARTRAGGRRKRATSTRRQESPASATSSSTSWICGTRRSRSSWDGPGCRG